MVRVFVLLALAASFVLRAAAAPARKPAAKVVLSREEFRDKVYACWLGKNIGGTLGAPLEGRREIHNLTFYQPVPTTPSANDDLDLQLLWLKALEERGPALTCRDLGEYWLKYVPVDWNEYGVGKANMRRGFLPPLSGQYKNKQWRDSNGAWIRSEIWACVAPGCPALAARYAWADACVDHGAAEGTYAELFTAALESAAFVEKDRDRLLQIGLSYIPPDCAVARSIRAAMDAHRQGLDLKAAREAVIEASKSTGWFMAPQNVAFTMLGWLYGDGDFGKSLCAAVNCGDDTDCTGATLGSLLGILNGTKGIPENWRKPVGEGIKNVAIAGFKPPATLPELTDATVRMADTVLAFHKAPVEIREGAGTANPAGQLALVDATAARELWARSPYCFVYDFPAGLRASLDIVSDPEIEAGKPHTVKLILENRSAAPANVSVAWKLPEGLTADALQASVKLPRGGSKTCEVALSLGEGHGVLLHGTVEIARAGQEKPDAIPFTFAAPVGVAKEDMALARLGAKATSDSELDRPTDKGGTQKAIDGVIAAPDDFEGKRWHSALTPHPHWLAIELPATRAIGRVIIHFADPGGHPVDFDCEVSADGKTWQKVCGERGYANRDQYEKAFPPVEARHFRLTILRSASAQWPDAAQVSEVELLPK